jgi:phosphatidylserine/phosphatidylglycerophosphate/cardiolipin synthase-like enzyme
VRGAAPKWLKHQNIELVIPKKADAFANLRKLHHKLMVIDEHIVLAGSFNYTEPANDLQRREHLRARLDPRRGRGDRSRSRPTRKLARHFKQEIERIISLSER